MQVQCTYTLQYNMSHRLLQSFSKYDDPTCSSILDLEVRIRKFEHRIVDSENERRDSVTGKLHMSVTNYSIYVYIHSLNL